MRVLLPVEPGFEKATNQCNAACEYCLADKTRDHLSIERLGLIVDKVLEHMDARGIGALTIRTSTAESFRQSP